MGVFVRLFGKIKDTLAKNRYFRLYLCDPEIRLTLKLLFGLLLNLAYVAFNAVSGILYRSAWLITAAAYHTMLVAIHYIILRVGRGKRERREENRACVRGGILLLLVDFAVTAMILNTLFSGRTASYSALVVVTLFAFAVYNLISTAAALARKSEEERPAHRAAHTVRIVAALMSAFNLVTAILPKLSLDARAAMALQLICGVFVSVFVLALTVVMISSSIKHC